MAPTTLLKLWAWLCILTVCQKRFQHFPPISFAYFWQSSRSVGALSVNLVYNRNHYFGLGLLPNPNPNWPILSVDTVTNTKTTFQRKNLGSDVDTEIGPWFWLHTSTCCFAQTAMNKFKSEWQSRQLLLKAYYSNIYTVPRGSSWLSEQLLTNMAGSFSDWVPQFISWGYFLSNYVSGKLFFDVTK